MICSGSRSVARDTRALHLVSAYAAEMGLTLGQQPCEAKSNEIEAIKELLPALALEGAVVTIDAIGCQTEIARRIVDGGGDYVLAVKDNQPTLATALREFFACLNQPGYPSRPCDTHETVDKGHGRFETRRCVVVGELVGGNMGLGFLLVYFEGQGNTAAVFVVIGALTLIGIIAYYAVVIAEKRVLHYLPSAQRNG